MNFSEEVRNIIDFSDESTNIDFKYQSYPLGKTDKKFDIIKDFAAFSNHPSKQDKFIIIGVKKNDNKIKINNEVKHYDQASYQQLVNEYIEPEIKFEYSIITYNGYQLGYFRIFENNDFPYLIKKDIISKGSVQKIIIPKGTGYIRSGTSTRILNHNDYKKLLTTPVEEDRTNEVTTELIQFKELLHPNLLIDLDIIDINIINNSNKSIKLFPELVLNKEYSHLLSTKNKYFQSHIKFSRLSKSHKNTDTGFTTPLNFDKEIIFNYNNFGCEIYLVNPKNNERKSITIEQGQKIKNLFSKKLIIGLSQNDFNLKGKIVLRSDSFLNGPKEVIFSKKYSKYDN